MLQSYGRSDGLGREYWSWFGFWAEFVVLGLLAIIGAYFASQGGQPGDYAAGLILSLTAIALAFFRLKLRFDGRPADWSPGADSKPLCRCWSAAARHRAWRCRRE